MFLTKQIIRKWKSQPSREIYRSCFVSTNGGIGLSGSSKPPNPSQSICCLRYKPCPSSGGITKRGKRTNISPHFMLSVVCTCYGSCVKTERVKERIASLRFTVVMTHGVCCIWYLSHFVFVMLYFVLGIVLLGPWKRKVKQKLEPEFPP